MKNLEYKVEGKRGMKYRLAVLLSALSLGLSSLTGCTTTQKGVLTGAGLGAGLGAIIGHQSGETGEGAAIGAAIGGITGAIVGEQMETKYCPECGKGYTGDMEYCPENGTKLEYKK